MSAERHNAAAVPARAGTSINELAVVLVSVLIAVIMQTVALIPVRDYRYGIMSAQFEAALLMDAYVFLRVIVAMFRKTSWPRWKLVALMCLTSPFWIHLMAMIMVAIGGRWHFSQGSRIMPMILLCLGGIFYGVIAYWLLTAAEKRMGRSRLRRAEFDMLRRERTGSSDQ